jgi:hypothetical protein
MQGSLQIDINPSNRVEKRNGTGKNLADREGKNPYQEEAWEGALTSGWIVA